MIYEMKLLSAENQKKAQEFMRLYKNISDRYVLTIDDNDQSQSLSPSSELFDDYKALCMERIKSNPYIKHYDLVSMHNGEVLGIFYFNIDENQEGHSFTIYQINRTNPYIFGKDVNAAYDFMHEKVTHFNILIRLDGNNKNELERTGRGAIYHLSKRYGIQHEMYTIKKVFNQVSPFLILRVFGALV